MGGGEVGQLPFRDLGEAGREDLHDVPGEPRLQLGELEAGLGIGERVFRPAQVAQVYPGGEAEEVGCGEDGAEGQAGGLFVDASANAEVHGRVRFGQAILLWQNRQDLTGRRFGLNTIEEGSRWRK